MNIRGGRETSLPLHLASHFRISTIIRWRRLGQAPSPELLGELPGGKAICRPDLKQLLLLPVMFLLGVGVVFEMLTAWLLQRHPRTTSSPQSIQFFPIRNAEGDAGRALVLQVRPAACCSSASSGELQPRNSRTRGKCGGNRDLHRELCPYWG